MSQRLLQTLNIRITKDIKKYIYPNLIQHYSNQAEWELGIFMLEVFIAVYSCLKLGIIEQRLKEGFSWTHTFLGHISCLISPVVYSDFY